MKTPDQANKPTTLVVVAHPRLSHSRVNKALLQEIVGLEHVSIIDLYARYPDFAFDLDAECGRLLSVQNIVLQFPFQWYSTPALLKQWQDSVIHDIVYLSGREAMMHGKRMMVAMTTGAPADTYDPLGRNLFSLEDLLKPLRCTANRCGMEWVEPFLAVGVRALDEAALAELARSYRNRLLALQDGHDRVADMRDP